MPRLRYEPTTTGGVNGKDRSLKLRARVRVTIKGTGRDPTKHYFFFFVQTIPLEVEQASQAIQALKSPLGLKRALHIALWLYMAVYGCMWLNIVLDDCVCCV